MVSPLDRRGAWSALGVVLLLVVAIGFGDAMTSRVAAQGELALTKPEVASLEDSQPPRLRARFVSHHLDEDHDEHGQIDDDGDGHGEEHEDEEHEWDELEDELQERELEWEARHAELERMHMQSLFGSLELVEKLTKIAKDSDAIAVLAVNSLADALEPEERVEVLTKVAQESPSLAARRIAHLRLAEAYASEDQRESAWEALKPLLFD